MTLLEECIQVFGNDIIVFDREESDKLFSYFESLVDFTWYGKVDKNKYPNRKCLDVEKLSEIIFSEHCFIFWDEGTLPVLKVDFSQFVENQYDVLAVSYQTWVLNDENDLLIEFLSNGEVNLYELG